MRKFTIGVVLLLLPFSNCTLNRSEVSSAEIQPLCKVLASPSSYYSTTLTTAGIVLGYHDFVVYSRDCLNPGMVGKIILTYDQRSSVLEKLDEMKDKYSSPVLRNNLYAEITFKGRVEKTDPTRVGANTYVLNPQFLVDEIISVRVLGDEVLPPLE